MDDVYDVTDHDPDSDFGVFVRAKDRGMPTFTLTAGDISSDLMVDFWVLVQLRVRHDLAMGRTLEQALDHVRNRFDIPVYHEALNDAKLDGAARIAEAMRNFPNRKLAD